MYQNMRPIIDAMYSIYELYIVAIKIGISAESPVICQRISIDLGKF